SRVWVRSIRRGDLDGSLSPGGWNARPAVIAGGDAWLAPPLSLQLFGSTDFTRWATMTSRLTLRAPTLLGVTPLVSVGVAQPFRGRLLLGDFELRYDEGPWHMGARLHASRSGSVTTLSSTGYVRYVERHWDLGLDHVAQWLPRGAKAPAA